MLTVYLKKSDASSRKAKKWLEAHQVPFKEVNLMAQPISVETFRKWLEWTRAGTAELLVTRGEAYRQINRQFHFEALKLDELIQVVQAHPNLLKAPILFDGKNLQVGYNEEEMRRFLPRIYRKIRLKNQAKTQ